MKKNRKILLITLIVFIFLFIASGIFSGIVTLKKTVDNEIVYYSNRDDLLLDWASKYKSIENEYFAHFFSKTIDDRKVYFIKKTYKGQYNNTYIESFSSYYNYSISSFFTSTRMEGTIHTHPYKNPMFIGSNTSTSDVLGLFIPGNRTGFIVFPNGEVGQYYRNYELVIINPLDE